MKQHFLKVDSNIRLSIYDFGGIGPPLIFCHFTGGLGMLWQPIAEKLLTKFHCFAYDARGHGNSSKPDNINFYDWNKHLRDLIAITEYIKNTTNKHHFYGVGHSFGAACLSQATLFNKNIQWKKIILIEPIIGPDIFDFRQEIMSEIARKRRPLFSKEQLDNQLRNKHPYKSWDMNMWEIYKKHGFIVNENNDYLLKCSPEIESYQYLFGNPKGWFNKLKKIHVPTLIIYGEKSELLPIAYYQLEQIPKAFLVKIPKATHFITQEHPQTIVNWIKNWF
ncbi:MAG: alpha/beta hydrolase [Candidatus Hydrogenedens sp.]|nr:alpha/beta hydrolase [Candidatus Hydrogenedens sp.]